jgi:hypothetical protein
MIDPDECLRRSQECLNLAKELTAGEAQKVLLDMAAAWLALEDKSRQLRPGPSNRSSGAGPADHGHPADPATDDPPA